MLERVAAAVPSAARFESAISSESGFEFVRGTLAFILDPFARVGSALTLVREPLAFVGPAVSFLCAMLSLVKLAQHLQPAVGLDTRALSSASSMLGGLALPLGSSMSSKLRASLSVLSGKPGALLEHVRSSSEDRCQTLRVFPLADHRRADPESMRPIYQSSHLEPLARNPQARGKRASSSS